LITYGVGTGVNSIDQTNKSSSVGSADVLRSLVCTHCVHEALKASQNVTYQKLMNKQASGNTLTLVEQTLLASASKSIPEKGDIFSVYKEVPATCFKAAGSAGNCGAYTGGVFQFPYVKDEASNPLKDYGLSAADGSLMKSNNIPNNLTGICGTISYTINRGDGEGATPYTKRANRYIPAKLQGLRDMIAILEPVSKQLITQLKSDKDGKRAIDPDTYVVYNDGSDKGFFIDPNPSNAAMKYFIDNQRINALDINNLPAINWPIGSDEMLSAAAAYQVALADAQKIGKADVKKDAKKKFNKAKSKGWIAAGGYYRMLADIQDAAATDYSSYRLTGYKGLDKPFEKEDDLSNRVMASYGVLFNAATPAGSKQQTPIGIIDNSYKDTLNKSLAWIFLSYPYSKLHGSALVKSLSKTATGVGFDAPIFEKSGYGLLPLTKEWIYVKLVFGSIFLPITPPAAIPLLMNIPMDWLKFDVNEVFKSWQDQMGKDSADLDPIIKLQNLGQVMMEQSVAYIDQLKGFFIAITSALSTAAVIYWGVSWAVAPGSFMGSLTGVSTALETGAVILNGLVEMSQTIIFMYLPIGLAVLVPMFVSGAMFAIYIPLIPYLLFLFGVISWFISVLVLMAAAPIICFLMLWGNSSQENPLLAKEAEQFMMQLIGVFFRPTLMIIGLIAGMVLSYIGVDVLNLGFSDIVKSVIDTSKSGVADVNLIKQVGVVVIYTFTMVTLINMCFSPIHLLYSEAMRIAGIQAPATGMEERGLEAVKGAATQLAQEGAGGMKEGAVGMKGAKVGYATAKGKEKKEDTKGATSP